MNLGTAALASQIILAMLLAACAPTSDAVARGRQIALRQCNACHTIAPGRTATSDDVGPSFMAIAALPDSDRPGLTRFLAEPHALDKIGEPDKLMPTYLLDAGERDDVVSFILSLRDIASR